MTHLTVERTLNRYAGRFAYLGKPPVAHNDHGPLCSCIRCEWTPPKRTPRCHCGRTHCSCSGDVA